MEYLYWLVQKGYMLVKKNMLMSKDSTVQMGPKIYLLG